MGKQFEKFAIDYFNYLDNILQDRKPGSRIRLNLRNIFSHPDATRKNLIQDAKILDELLDNYSDKNFILLMRDYPEFIRMMEKCFMYKNDDYQSVYAEFESNSDTRILYFSNDLFKAKATFKLTKIDDPTIGFFDEDRKVTIVEITISRCFGKQMCNTFKFVLQKFPTLDDEEDRILFDVFLRQASMMLKESFEKMMNSIYPICTSLVTDEYNTFYFWRDIIKYGLRIRKS